MPRRDSHTKFYEGRSNKRKHGLPRGQKLKRRRWLKRREEQTRLKKLHNPGYIPRDIEFNPGKGKGNVNHATRKEGHQASGRYNKRRNDAEHPRARGGQ